jgi:hypothetical protein
VLDPVAGPRRRKSFGWSSAASEKPRIDSPRLQEQEPSLGLRIVVQSGLLTAVRHHDGIDSSNGLAGCPCLTVLGFERFAVKSPRR